MEDNISLGNQVLQIESNLKEEISAIREILDMVVSNKIDLEKLKTVVKDNLQNPSDE